MLHGGQPTIGFRDCALRSMTETSKQTAEPESPIRPLNERLVFALRQAAAIAVALLVAGLVTARMRPDEVLERGGATTPFLWAIVVWLAVLIFGAVAFDRPQTDAIDTQPLYGGMIAGAIVFVVGAVSIDGGTASRRILYAFANALGAVMFWWGLFSLAYLIVRSVRD